MKWKGKKVIWVDGVPFNVENEPGMGMIVVSFKTRREMLQMAKWHKSSKLKDIPFESDTHTGVYKNVQPINYEILWTGMGWLKIGKIEQTWKDIEHLLDTERNDTIDSIINPIST